MLQLCILISDTDLYLILLVPGTVQNLDTERVSASEVLVSWDEPEVTNETIVRYEVRVSRYQQRANFQPVELVALEEAAQDVTASTTQTTISELGESSMYGNITLPKHVEISSIQAKNS